MHNQARQARVLCEEQGSRPSMLRMVPWEPGSSFSATHRYDASQHHGANFVTVALSNLGNAIEI